VTTVSVRHILVDEGTVAIQTPLLAVLNGGLYGEDIHSVDLEAGNVLSTLVVVGQSGGTVGSGTHTVLVV